MNGRPTTINPPRSDTSTPPKIPERRPRTSSARPFELKSAYKPERFPPKQPLALRNSGGEERNYSKLIEEGNFLIINGEEYKTVKSDLEKIRDLGKGTCGSVVLMRHNLTGVNIAVKQMMRRNNSTENKRINRDLTSILKCQSNYIVNCMGTILDENEAWLCMEEMGTCLEKLYTRILPKLIPECIIGNYYSSFQYDKGMLPVNTLLSNLLNILNMLLPGTGGTLLSIIASAYIKPSNILLNMKGEIKLCDFGISGYLENSIAVTNNQDHNAYTAPELINKREHDEFDSRSDVWSLAISLLELSIGCYPYFKMNPKFKEMKMFAKLVTILQEDAPKVPENAGFSREYKEFISQCLNKKCTDRPKFEQLLESDFLVLCAKDKHVNVSEWYKNI